MALVNAAIDEIGTIPFQWKLFFFNGFGYAVDSVSHIHEVRFYFNLSVAFGCLLDDLATRGRPGIW